MTITKAPETDSQSTESKFNQGCLVVAITSPVVIAVQSQLQDTGTGSGRMQALSAANAAMNRQQSADALKAGQGDANGIVKMGATHPLWIFHMPIK